LSSYYVNNFSQIRFRRDNQAIPFALAAQSFRRVTAAIVSSSPLLGALAITDECSLARIVKAHAAAREHGIKLIVGSEFRLAEGLSLVALAPSQAACSELTEPV